MELKTMPRPAVEGWYRDELCTAFPPCECKHLPHILALMDSGRYELLGLYEGDVLLGYAALWSHPDWPGYVLLDYLGITSARRGGGLGGRMLGALAERYRGRAVVLLEAEAEDSGGPEEERPIRRRRLGFYRRNGCTPVYGSFNCGLRCQVFTLGPDPVDREDLKAAHRAIYGPARPDVVIDPPEGAEPTPPPWM